MKQTLIHSLPALFLAALIAAQPCAARAASTSELLEKGIYTEETKGDLDAAIAIYQQLTAEAKASQSLAAQAQFRIGQCLLKKKRDAEAMAAFEKLIQQYPDEKELVAKARGYLPGELALDPVPWVDGERLQLTLALGGGMEIGMMEMRADLVDFEGRKVWRVGRRMSGGGHMISHVEVEPETFAPLASYWKHTLLGEASAVFKAGEVEISRVGGEPMTVRPDKTVYDNEEVMHLMRRLPLAIGYKTTVATLTTLGGGAVLPIGIEVTAKETVETPAGNFNCFKVVMSVGQSFWISDDAHRYLVKFDVNSAVAKLASIRQQPAAAPVTFRDDTLGVSLTAPAEWVFHRQSGDRKGRTTIHLLDPAANADHAMLRLVATETLSAPARQSPRTWAEEEVRVKGAKELQEFKVRDASWKNHPVAGRVGISFVADYIEGGKPKAMLSIYAVGPKTCETFVLACAPGQFEALRPAFESIVASYRTH